PNKDVALFPEKINGKYRALHRPHNEGFGKPSIWYGESPDLIHWGNHKCIARPYDTKWECMKIGGGSSPIKTDQGWLTIYHGKGENQIYSLGLILMDLEDPSKIIKRTEEPVLVPETDYETKGFFPNVVFTNGAVKKDNGEVYIYYGACDETTNLAVSDIDSLLGMLR
ncbi:MAG: glycosidase, partial [Fibrobacterota bacterium]